MRVWRVGIWAVIAVGVAAVGVQTGPEAGSDAERLGGLPAEGAPRLDGGVWTVTLVPLYGSGPESRDVLVFQQGMVWSQHLGEAGYAASPYTVEGSGTGGGGFWQAVQAQPGRGVAFWRGEVRGGAMRGIMSHHPHKGSVRDFSFMAALSGEVQPPGALGSDDGGTRRPAATGGATGSGPVGAISDDPRAP